MREILFRGRRIDNGEWVEGNLVIYETGTFICNWIGDAWQYQVDPATIGQFTGLHDKNGKRIFEGDIVEYKDFSDGLYLFREQPKTKGVIKITNLLSGIYLKGMGTFEGNKAEVISTIHDKEVTP